MRKIRWLLSFTALLLSALAGWAQFTPKEIEQRPRWEAFLKEAEIVKREQLSFERGVTEPWKLTLKQGGVVRKAIWKDVMGVRGGYLEGWRYEIAAYIMDKLLGLGLVPPTVLRNWENRPGSCQLWIDGTSLYRDLTRTTKDQAPFQTDAWRNFGYAAQFFDNLIGNEDRHMGNVLVTRDFRGVLIDHSRTFRIGKSFVESIPFSGKNVPAENLMRRLPRALVQRAAALTEDSIRGAVGSYLSDAEIRAVLARQKLLLLEVQKIIDRFGERDVLY